MTEGGRVTMIEAQGHRMGKAYSVGAKKRARKGRPRKNVARREPNGRAARSQETQEAVQAVAIRQRVRLVGLDNAASQLAESAIGVLCLLGRLATVTFDESDDAAERKRKLEAANRAAYDAGVWWRSTIHGLHRLIGAPIPYPRSPAWEMVSHGPVTDDYVEDLSEISDPEARAAAEDGLRKRKLRLLCDYERGRLAMGENALAVEALVIHDRVDDIERAKNGLASLVEMRR